MATELTPVPEPLDHECIVMVAVTAAIKAGFDPANTRTVTAKQVMDACAIIALFLREAEKQNWPIEQWRVAVENLNINLGKSREGTSNEDHTGR